MKSAEIKPNTLLIARGIAGSGKSFKVNEICNSLTAHRRYFFVCSSDNYFMQDGKYNFDINKLGRAHQSCQELCRLYLDRGCDVVIVDNTNISAKECRIYVEMGLEFKYNIEFLEPSTPWAFDLDELEKRNQHNVPRHALERMLRRWVPNMTIEKALSIQQESSGMHKDEEAASEAWETKNERVVEWNKEQTEYLYKRLNSFKKKDDYNEQAG